jgi:putative tricarboxylic transport membrane protein
MKFNDALFGAALFALGAFLLLQVQGFPKIPGQEYGAGAFPGLIGVGFLGVGALLVVAGIRHRADAPWAVVADWMGSRRHVGALLSIVLGVIAYILWADDLGFLVLAPAVLFVWFVMLGVRPLPAAVTALVVVLLIWYAFYKLLRVPLPWGVLKSFAF